MRLKLSFDVDDRDFHDSDTNALDLDEVARSLERVAEEVRAGNVSGRIRNSNSISIGAYCIQGRSA